MEWIKVFCKIKNTFFVELWDIHIVLPLVNLSTRFQPITKSFGVHSHASPFCLGECPVAPEFLPATGPCHGWSHRQCRVGLLAENNFNCKRLKLNRRMSSCRQCWRTPVVVFIHGTSVSLQRGQWSFVGVRIAVLAFRLGLESVKECREHNKRGRLPDGILQLEVPGQESQQLRCWLVEGTFGGFHLFWLKFMGFIWKIG